MGKITNQNLDWWPGKRKRQNRSDMFSVVKKTGRGSEMKSEEHTYQKKLKNDLKTFPEKAQLNPLISKNRKTRGPQPPPPFYYGVVRIL